MGSLQHPYPGNPKPVLAGNESPFRTVFQVGILAFGWCVYSGISGRRCKPTDSRHLYQEENSGFVIFVTIDVRNLTHSSKISLDMFQLDYLSTAEVSGPDAGAFLHAQLSADISGLQPSGSTFACYCNPKGKVIALLLVCRLDSPDSDPESGRYLVAGASMLMSSTLKRLGMYVLRSKVTIGPDTANTIYGSERDNAGELFSPVASVPFGRYLVSNPDAVESAGSGPWKLSEIRHGVCWLDENTSERFLPQMLGFESIGALSFSKGCYPGQEIVARARYLGTIKRRSMLIEVDALDAEGLQTLSGRKIILNCGESENDAIIIDHSATGTGTSLLRAVSHARWESTNGQVTLYGDRYQASVLPD
jgi:folate-binding protein YgfZ